MDVTHIYLTSLNLPLKGRRAWFLKEIQLLSGTSNNGIAASLSIELIAKVSLVTIQAQYQDIDPKGLSSVIPAQAGIQKVFTVEDWIPACAGMTTKFC